MAINAYTGIMGSGKSYECVENVILPALLTGRRVVTNIAGLKDDEIAAYLVDKEGADPVKLGKIVHITNEMVTLDNCFPVEQKGDVPPPASMVQGGDLVIIDECWRWWAQGCKILPAHMTFFRMHRHFTDSVTNGTCDIALVVQDISDLDRKIKVVVENTYRMSKHKALGTPTRYHVDVYGGYRITKSTPKIREMQRTYNKEIFALYSSYSQSKAGGGKEGAIDKRANVLRGAFFTLVIPVFLILAVVGSWLLWRFFHPQLNSSAQTPAGASKVSTNAPASAGSVSAQPASAITALVESDWRVKGHYLTRGRHVVVLVRGDAVTTLIDPYGFTYDGFNVRGTYYDHVVTNYTGVDSSESKSGGVLVGNLK